MLKTIEDISNIVFNIISNQFNKKSYVKSQESDEYFKILFDTGISEISNNFIEERNHICSVVYFLKDTREALKSGKKFKSPFTDNVNEVLFCPGLNMERPWVFKPVNGEVKDEINEGIEPGTRGKREHVAHLLNFANQFPIPLCIYTELNGKVGSLQCYMKGISWSQLEWLTSQEELSKEETKSLKKEIGNFEEWRKILADKTLEDVCRSIGFEQLQALVIFDLLFVNCDRNSGNFLFCFNENKLDLVGIDHGECFSGSKYARLNIDCTSLFPQLRQDCFQRECLEIIKPDYLNKYEQIIQSQGLDQGVVDWMRNVVAPLIEYVVDDKNAITLSVSEIGILIRSLKPTLWDNQKILIEDISEINQSVIACKEIINRLKLKK